MRSLLLSFILCQTAVSAREVVARFTPFTVGKGPLLSFIRPENAAGHPRKGAPDRREALYLFDPATHKSPHAIWKRSSPMASLVGRLAQHRFLLEHRQSLFRVDLEQGEITPLLNKDDRTELIHFSDDHLLFLHHLTPDPLNGIKLGRNANNKVVPKDWFRPRAQLYRMRTDGTGQAERLSDTLLAKIIEVEGNNIWAITGEQSQRLVRIDHKGTIHQIADLGLGLLLHDQSSFAFNPSRTYLAMGVQYADQEFFEERTLIVCDLLKRTIAFKDDKAKALNIFDSIIPPLIVGWTNDDIVSYGGYIQGERMYNLAKGEHLTEEQMKPFLPKTLASRKPGRIKTGHFEHEHGRLYFLGQQEPVADVLRGNVATGTIAVSADHCWAAYSDKRDLFLIDGVKKKKTKLLPGWCYDPHWLPERK